MPHLVRRLLTSKRRLTLLGAVVVALGGGVGALAYYSSNGSGVAAASVGTLNAPTGVNTSHTPGTTTVGVGWTASTTGPGTVAPQGYYVTRTRTTDSSTANACGTSAASLTSSTSCSDSGVPNGTYHYTVTAVYGSWAAASAASGDVTVLKVPSVLSIDRADSSPANGGTVHWTVTFSLSVSGVDTTDFVLVRAGVTGGSVTGVAAVSGSAYTVTATTGSGDGTLGLNLVDDDSIADGLGYTLDGAGDGSFAGQTYTIDKTAPTVSSVGRAGGSASVNAGPLSWTVTFSESVSNLAAGNFSLATSSTGGVAPSIASVTASGGAPSATWTVTVSTAGTTGQNGGSIGLNLSSVGTVADPASNALATSSFTGQAYIYDTTAPIVAVTQVNGSTRSFTYTTNVNVTSIGGTCGVASGDNATVSWSLSSQSGSASCTAGSWSSGAFGTAVSADGTYSAQASQGDGAGNTGSDSKTVILDKTAPTNGLSLVNQSTQAGPAATTNPTTFLSGTSLYFDKAVASSFKLRNALADSLSGPASSTFAALGGTTTGWTFSGSTVSTPSGGPYVSNQLSWTASATGVPTEAVTGSDVAGNVNTGTTLTFVNDSTSPVTPVVTFPAASGNYTNTSWDAGGSGGACAASKICGTASDAGSGVAKLQLSIKATSGANTNKYWDGSGFSSATEVLFTASGTTSWSLGFPSSNFGDASYLATAYAVDNVGNFTSKTAAFNIDNVAPTSSVALVSPTPNAAGWNNANVTVSLSATDAVSGVATIFWSESGAQTASGSHAGGTSFSLTLITAEGTTTITYHAVDNAGNVEGDKTYVVKLDKTVPTNSLTLVNQGTTGGSATSYLSATKIFYNGSASSGRSFQIQNAVADGLSGAASSLFAALGGTSTGFSFTSSTVSTPSGGPYVSNAFTWSSGTTSAPTETVTGADVAGNTLANGSLTLTNDVTAPTTTATPTPAANGAGWNNANVSIALSATDGAGSGVASITYSATGAQTISGTTVAGSAATMPAITTEGTTTISYAALDNVGNVETTKTLVVKLDKTTPAAPASVALANGGGVGSAYIDSANVSGVSVTVTGVAEVSASDTVTVTLSDGTHTATGTAAAGSSSVTVTGINASTLTDGTSSITISAVETDPAGNVSGSTSAVAAFSKDTVAPGYATSPTTNPTLANGGISGKADAVDTVSIVYTEKINASSLCSAWSDNTNASTLSADNDITVTITDGGTTDTLTVSSATCTFNFGSLNLKANYVAAGATFAGAGGSASTITWDPTTLKLTIRLGALATGSVSTGVSANNKPVYTASTSQTDLGGNAISGTRTASANSGF